MSKSTKASFKSKKGGKQSGGQSLKSAKSKSGMSKSTKSAATKTAFSKTAKDRASKRDMSMKKSDSVSVAGSRMGGRGDRVISPSLATLPAKPKKPRRKRRPMTPKENVMCILVITIIIALLIVGLILALVFTVFKPKVVTEGDQADKLKVNVTDMSVWIVSTFGVFWYLPEKVVPDCKNVLIYSLSLTPVVEEVNETWMMYTRLKFVYRGNSQKIPVVPENTPCGDGKIPQWCQNGTCVVTNVTNVVNYIKKAAPIPLWKEENEPVGMEPLDDSGVYGGSSIEWPSYLASKSKCKVDTEEKKECEQAPVKFRSCTNPPPSLGAKPCWSAGVGETLKIQDWPVQFDFAKDCSCEKKLDFISCDKYVYYDACRMDKFDIENNIAFSDSHPCCYDRPSIVDFKDEPPKGKPGRCLLGTCMPMP